MTALEMAYIEPVAQDLDNHRWQALQRRDPDAGFVYSVASTGVYCRPSCAARPALRRNVAFHDTAADAEAAGFRPCRRCRPDLPPKAEREAALAAAACRIIEAAEEPPVLADLAAQAGVSPHHFHRLFRRVVGVTPKAYADAQRQRRVQTDLAEGAGVTETLYAAGFNSSGRFYEAAPAMLGMTPGAYRRGGEDQAIRYAFGRSALGLVLVAAADRGVCAILLGDSEADLLTDLTRRFRRADIGAAGDDFAGWVEQVVAFVDDPAGAQLNLPLDIRGTAFQRRVWEALRAIPPGQTATYGAVAQAIGSPRAVRAVATACAGNPLAVAVPCHRVLPATGGIGGYRWGAERKRRLLVKEGQ